jgi:hypothetical protein
MMELEASFAGTIRTILILLIIWWVLRLLMRAGKKRGGRPPGTQWTDDPNRPKGEIRIENLKDDKRDKDQKPGGNITDADFEELK